MTAYKPDPGGDSAGAPARSRYDSYRAAAEPPPDGSWTWNLYGTGLEKLGRGGRAECFPVRDPGADEILVRVDCVGICYSDIKLIQQGGHHPKLYNRDLAQEPTRIGHEVSLTVVKVGSALQGRFYRGQRLAVQPELIQNGRRVTFGFTLPGALTQYQLIGPAMLERGEQAGLLPVDRELGYAEAALLEPWAAVVASYTQRRRLWPRPGGRMWILGRPGDGREYRFSAGLERPGTIVATGLPNSVRALLSGAQADLVVRDGVLPDAYVELSAQLTGGEGFDDIIVLDPRSADRVGAAAAQTAIGGTLNLVAEEPLDGLVPVDVGRLHYDSIAIVGNQGPDIAASYGASRNRCELKAGGTMLVVGAGGPMGQMHLQRALMLPSGPDLIIAAEIEPHRLRRLRALFQPLARVRGREIWITNPHEGGRSLVDTVRSVSEEGADDVIVCVAALDVVAEAAALLKPGGMLMLFAGLPYKSMAPLALSQVYLDNAQFTGNSGPSLADQVGVMKAARTGTLSPAGPVSAIGGIHATFDGVRAVMEASTAGKVILFPQIPELPLTDLDELPERWPELAAQLGPGPVWTQAAERLLIESSWTWATDEGCENLGPVGGLRTMESSAECSAHDAEGPVWRDSVPPAGSRM